jgi:hypothetical protein
MEAAHDEARDVCRAMNRSINRKATERQRQKKGPLGEVGHKSERDIPLREEEHSV